MSFTRITSAVATLAVLALGATAEVAHADERTYRTEHFALTWSDVASDPDAPDLGDRNGDGVPDAVARMSTAFEEARAFLVDDLGYQAPPTKGRYNLYLSSEIDRGVVRVSPGGNGRSRPSFVTIPTYLMRPSATIGQVRSFAVHEYFHAIQNGYDSTEDSWMKEASSTWVEGLFEPAEGHNQVYLYDFVPRLELGLQSTDGLHEYGAFLFIQFIAERFGGGSRDGAGLVREMWEAMAVPEAIEGAPDDDSIGALQRVLSAREVTLEDAWGEFVLWAWQLRRFEDGDRYRRALRDQRWPSAPARRVDDESCRLTANAPDVMPGLSGDYVRFTPSGRALDAARLTVRGPVGTSAFALVRVAGGPAAVRVVSFGDDGVGALDLDFGGRAGTRVLLGMGNGSLVPATIEFSLRAQGSTAVTVDAPVVPPSTIYGTGIFASGRVHCAGSPAPFAHVVVTRTETVSGATETFDVTTDAFGNWTLLTVPAVTSRFAVDVVDPLLSPASSPESTVGVRVAVNMTMADDEVAEGDPVVVEGNVAPVHAGLVVLEYRRPNGGFVRGTEMAVDTDGNYRFEFVLPGPGVWEVRVTMPDTGDADHLPGDSAPKLVQVGET